MPSIPNSNSSSHNIPFESSPPTYCIWLIILQGFFRRSIQQKIQYRPCTKNQQCAIQRVNRNRCQYCRLKKCIAAGMSRDGEYYLTISRQSDNLITQMSTRDNRTEEMTKTPAQFFYREGCKEQTEHPWPKQLDQVAGDWENMFSWWCKEDYDPLSGRILGQCSLVLGWKSNCPDIKDGPSFSERYKQSL